MTELDHDTIIDRIDEAVDEQQRAMRGELQGHVAAAYADARTLRGPELRARITQLGLPPGDEDSDVCRLQAVAFALGAYERTTRGAETLEEIKAMYDVVSRGSPHRVCHSCMERAGATARFELGQVVATPGASALDGELLSRCLMRHAAGDWGVCCAEDRAENDRSLVDGCRVLSAYPIDESKPSEGHGDNTLWIITEADRSSTTLLLPEEY